MSSKKKSKNEDAPQRQGNEEELQTVDPKYIKHLQNTPCWKFTEEGTVLFLKLLKRWREHDKKNHTDVKFATETMGFDSGVNPGGASTNMKNVVARKKHCNGWTLYRLTCEFNAVLNEEYAPTDFAAAKKTGRVSHLNVKKSRQYMDEIWNLYDARIEFEPDARILTQKFERLGVKKTVRETLDMILRDFRDAIVKQYNALLPIFYWFRTKLGLTTILLGTLSVVWLLMPSSNLDTFEDGYAETKIIDKLIVGPVIFRDALNQPLTNAMKNCQVLVKNIPRVTTNERRNIDSPLKTENDTELLEAQMTDTSQDEVEIVGNRDTNDRAETADLYVETNVGDISISVHPSFEFNVVANKLTSYKIPKRYLSPELDLFPDNDSRCFFNGETYLCKIPQYAIGPYKLHFSKAEGYTAPQDVQIEHKEPSTYIKRFYQPNE